jgi:hypothetical protein
MVIFEMLEMNYLFISVDDSDDDEDDIIQKGKTFCIRSTSFIFFNMYMGLHI